MLLVGYASACRRSELVAFDVEHLKFTREGLTLTIIGSSISVVEACQVTLSLNLTSIVASKSSIRTVFKPAS